MIKLIAASTALLIVALSGYTWLALHWSYSTGARAGYLQKLSRQGTWCKTLEGEMAMGPMPGTVSERFHFTVPDDALATKLYESLGKRMVLHYEQHKGIPSSCFGETGYFVTAVNVTG